MLTRNYVAIADQTQRPFQTSKSTRSHRSWAWDPSQRKAGQVKRVDPKTQVLTMPTRGLLCK